MPADPYPGQIREALEACKAEGLPFALAWKQALKAVGKRRPSWPLDFMRDVFGRAYVGAKWRNDMTLVVEPFDGPPGGKTSKGRVETSARCRWGQPCSHVPLDGQRFCPEHLERLRKIKRSFKGERASDFQPRRGREEDEGASATEELAA